MTRCAAGAVASLLALAVAACACTDGGHAGDTRRDASPFPADLPRPAYETTAITVGGFPVRVEVADTAERRAYGCMFLEELPDERGMLFLYPESEPLRFWMRNTRIPLDLAYLRPDGSILNIHRAMEPLRETPGYSSAGSCRIALELPGGWFERHALDESARVDIPSALLLPDAAEGDRWSPEIPRRLDRSGR